MLGLKQQHDFGREIGQSPQRMESHSLERHPDRWIAPVYPFFVRRFLEHHLEGWFGLSAPIHIDLMNWLFETLAGTPVGQGSSVRQTFRMRDDLFHCPAIQT